MATTTPAYNLIVGESYDPVLLNAILRNLVIGAITGADISAGTITGSNIAALTITGGLIAADAITGVKIAADSIGASHIASNSISADDIQSDAVTATKILAGSITTDKIYVGAVTSDKITVSSLDAISANLGEVTSGTVTAALVRTSASPSASRVIMDSSGLRGYDSTLGATFKIPTDGTSPVFASGQIQSSTIIDTSIISGDFKSSSELPWVEVTDSGLAYRESGGTGLYGSGIKYGDGTKYGVGVQVYFGNASRPCVSVEKERTLADIRFYNRSTEPSGAAVIGDVACVTGTLRLCTTAGTPGTYKTFCTTDLYAPLASPTFTGTVTIPTPFTLGAVSVTADGNELNILDGVTANKDEINVLDGIPATLTATELGYVDGVTSAIQTQLGNKAPLASPTFTGTVTLPTDTYTVVWTDYSGTSTVTGWSSFTEKIINYKKIGETVFVEFSLSGTSNSASAYFTLPVTSSADIKRFPWGYGIDNGTEVSAFGLCYLQNQTIYFGKTSLALNNWTNSGTKTIQGRFWYES